MKKEMSRAQRRRQAKIRKMLLSLSMVLVLALAAVGGTIAWLTDETDTVTNTFTVGNIDITLTETGTDEYGNKNYKMIPGATLDKDPTVTVEAGSENAWVFVKIEQENDLADYITYSIATGWTMLEEGVYYRSYTAADEATYPVLANNQVTVRGDVDKDMMDSLSESKAYPKLKFTAYAIQSDNLTAADGTKVQTAAAAWALLNP